MHRVRERMPDRAALEPKPGNGAQEGVAHLDHVRSLDGPLQPARSIATPTSEKRPVAQFGDRLCSQVQLVSREPSNQRFELGPTLPTQRGAEDAGIDQQPHDDRSRAPHYRPPPGPGEGSDDRVHVGVPDCESRSRLAFDRAELTRIVTLTG